MHTYIVFFRIFYKILWNIEIHSWIIEVTEISTKPMKEMLQKDVLQFQKAIFFALFELKMTHYATGLQQFFIKRAGEFTFELTSICFEERIEEMRRAQSNLSFVNIQQLSSCNLKKRICWHLLFTIFYFFFP